MAKSQSFHSFDVAFPKRCGSGASVFGCEPHLAKAPRPETERPGSRGIDCRARNCCGGSPAANARIIENSPGSDFMVDVLKTLNNRVPGVEFPDPVRIAGTIPLIITAITICVIPHGPTP